MRHFFSSQLLSIVEYENFCEFVKKSHQ